MKRVERTKRAMTRRLAEAAIWDKVAKTDAAATVRLAMNCKGRGAEEAQATCLRKAALARKEVAAWVLKHPSGLQ